MPLNHLFSSYYSSVCIRLGQHVRPSGERDVPLPNPAAAVPGPAAATAAAATGPAAAATGPTAAAAAAAATATAAAATAARPALCLGLAAPHLPEQLPVFPRLGRPAPSQLIAGLRWRPGVPRCGPGLGTRGLWLLGSVTTRKWLYIYFCRLKDSSLVLIHL